MLEYNKKNAGFSSDKPVEQFYELIEKYFTFKMLFMLECNKKMAGFSPWIEFNRKHIDFFF